MQWNDDEIRFVLDQYAELDFSIVLAHWSNGPRIDMSSHSDTLSYFRTNQSLLFLLNVAFLAVSMRHAIRQDWIYGYFISAKHKSNKSKFNSENLNQVDNHKYLGVAISSNGNWAEHINNICQKATKQIFVLRKLKFTLNRNNSNKIYVTYILPLLEYACELWDGCCSRMQISWNCFNLKPLG